MQVDQASKDFPSWLNRSHRGGALLWVEFYIFTNTVILVVHLLDLVCVCVYTLLSWCGVYITMRHVPLHLQNTMKHLNKLKSSVNKNLGYVSKLICVPKEVDMFPVHICTGSVWNVITFLPQQPRRISLGEEAWEYCSSIVLCIVRHYAARICPRKSIVTNTASTASCFITSPAAKTVFLIIQNSFTDGWEHSLQVYP